VVAYGSQFLVDKLLEVHKGYENKTIICPQVLYLVSQFINKTCLKTSFLSLFNLKASKT